MRVNELTRKLGVSDMTVRRDLDALARQGVLEKVHGGAVPVVEASTHEPGFEAKSGLEPTAKEDIARAAAELVSPARRSRSRAVRRPSRWRTGWWTSPTSRWSPTRCGWPMCSTRRSAPRGPGRARPRSC
ncbi:hypothetical protein SHKM778_57410 [Streptomyces sp. KM77-8]|uniref:HTH deoR-type domain-containing protein n=1 Tax=Streptomyces haneummycinicus TaxID=3074435 RepID=A0AAT9HPH2_9ACTN